MYIYVTYVCKSFVSTLKNSMAIMMNLWSHTYKKPADTHISNHVIQIIIE